MTDIYKNNVAVNGKLDKAVKSKFLYSIICLTTTGKY